ncbi:MAG: tetratricopeptide repeat protein [Acidobacteria bacterium]|nr:tetratricopeptide repeat protein [Acidobacteriota bacterium]
MGQVRVSKGDFPFVPVLITLGFRGSPVQSMYCDDQGRFSFTSLVANEYRVSVDDDAYVPVGDNVNVNPEISTLNIVQLMLVPRLSKKKDDPASRVAGSNPYLIDPAEYYQRFPKKTLKEFDQGVEAEKKGKTNEAILHYEKAIRYSPDFSPAHNHLGSAYLSLQKFGEAESEFAAALKANQNDSQAHFNLANLLLLTKRYDQASTEIEEGLKREPNSAFGQFLQGSLYSHTNRPELAEKSLRTALQYDPKMSQASLQLVNLYLQQKRTPDAIAELEAYVKSFPDTPFAPQARDLLKRLRGEESGSAQ